MMLSPLSVVDVIVHPMNNEITNKHLISTSELAKKLGTTNDVIINVAKRCNINKEIRNGIVTYWNIQEVSQIIKELKEGNKSNNRSFELTQRLANTATSITIKENFLKATKDYIALIEMEKKQLAEENRQLQEKNQQLQEYQDKNKYIHQERHDRKKLRAEIVKEVRVRAHNNKCGYNATFIRYYKLYDETHNFPYKENYNEYLDTIQERGHLRELYKIILNDF